MKKKFLTLFLMFMACLCLCFGLAACEDSVTGRYYAYVNGELNTDAWIELKKGDKYVTSDSGSDGSSEGVYKVQDRNIAFYIDIFGYQEVLTSGTVKDGVLTLTTMGETTIFCKKGKKPADNTQSGSQSGSQGGSQSGSQGGGNGSGKCKTGHTYTAENKCSVCGAEWKYTEGLEFRENSDGGYRVDGIGTAGGDIVIPYGHNGKFVTSIGADAFNRCTKLTSVIIPDSVTEIGRNAFYNCTSLTSVTIGGGVTSIGGSAFYNTGYYNDASNWTGDVLYIGKYLIEAKDTLSDAYTVQQGTKVIAGGAFRSCTSLTSVTIGGGVTSIGGSAFSGCTSLTNVTIPDSVTSIGGSAFSGCTSLTNVTIPDSVTSIGESAFYNTGYYNDASNWTGGALYIGKDLIEVKDTLSGAYSIQQGTKVIADEAFSATVLASVTIPDSVTSIGNGAFGWCTYLTRVDITDLAAWCNIGFGDSTANPLYYARHLYLKGDAVTALTIPTGVTEIKPYAFYDCKSLTSVTIPDSMTSIGEYAFYDCKSLTSVTIGDSVTSIGEYAFYNCESLTSVTIPNSVISIGDEAFGDCYKIIEVWNHSNSNIQKGHSDYGGVAEYAKYVYTGNEESKQTVTDEGYIFYEDGEENYLLGYMGKETQLTLPATSPSGKQYEIYQYAFRNCTSLTSVTIPNNVTSIGDEAFRNCTSLTSITIGGGVTKIGDGAFRSCTSLTSVTIPDSVTEIGNQAFWECTSLTSITIPDSVTEIGGWVFCDCTALTSIKFQGTVAQWKKIQKSDAWNSLAGNYTITCTDGTITKSGNVTMFKA